MVYNEEPTFVLLNHLEFQLRVKCAVNNLYPQLATVYSHRLGLFLPHVHDAQWTANQDAFDLRLVRLHN
jgi:hypothetical protein